MCFLLIIISAGCSKVEEPEKVGEPEKVEEPKNEEVAIDDCYTGIVKFIFPENNSVQVRIIDTPKTTNGCPINIRCEVVFYINELTDSYLHEADIIEFKIIEYEAFKYKDGPCIGPFHYSCKVKPCK